MASSQDLKEVLKQSLETRGSLAEIKARLRAEVFAALEDPSEMKPTISNDNLLIFELIREFLEYNHCRYSTSVLVSEIGLPKTPLDRDFLRHELNIVEDASSRSVPLLYSLVSSYKDSHIDNTHRTQGLTPSLGNLRINGVKNGDEYEPATVIVRGERI